MKLPEPAQHASVEPQLWKKQEHKAPLLGQHTNPVCPSHRSTGLQWASSCSLSPSSTFPRGRSCSHQRKPRTFSSAVRTGGSTNKEQKLVFFQLLSSMAGKEKGQEEPKPRIFHCGVPDGFISINRENPPLRFLLTFLHRMKPKRSSFLFVGKGRLLFVC